MEGCHAEINWGLDPIESQSKRQKFVQPQLVQRQETLVMGVELRARQQPDTARFSQLWNWFLAEQMQLDIADSINAQTLYGLYTDYSSDRREYSLILATEVCSIDNPLENMVGIVIPAGYYLRFEANGAPADAAAQLWPQIWCYFETAPADIPTSQRAFTTDFELYEPQQTSIYIAVRG
jgi:predicted transcriptional regulator YdeE